MLVYIMGSSVFVEVRQAPQQMKHALCDVWLEIVLHYVGESKLLVFMKQDSLVLEIRFYY